MASRKDQKRLLTSTKEAITTTCSRSDEKKREKKRDFIGGFQNDGQEDIFRQSLQTDSKLVHELPSQKWIRGMCSFLVIERQYCFIEYKL